MEQTSKRSHGTLAALPSSSRPPILDRISTRLESECVTALGGDVDKISKLVPPKSEVDALGVITISRWCFERCCSNNKTPPIAPFLTLVSARETGGTLAAPPSSSRPLFLGQTPIRYYSQTVYKTQGTCAHTHRELIREWLWEPRGSSSFVMEWGYYVGKTSKTTGRTRVGPFSWRPLFLGQTLSKIQKS